MRREGGGDAREAPGTRVSTVDVANHEILAALREPGCPLCRVGEVAERRMVQAFLREGRYSPGARESFMRAGGFCRRHAWQLHREARDEGTGAGIADVYGQLAVGDVASLEQMAAGLQTRTGRRRVRRGLRRQGGCPVCVALARAGSAHAYFLGQLLGDEHARELFERSDGLCGLHLGAAVTEALRGDPAGAVSAFLARDHARRLDALSHELAEYDRKRDFRYAHERRGAEQASWTEVIRRYVGGEPGDRELPGARADESRPVQGSKLLETDPEEELMAEAQTSTRITAVGTVIVTVSDQDAALEFFTERLGFEKRTDTPYGDGQRWLDVAPPGSTTTIALVPPMGEGNAPGGETGIAFSTEDVDADHAELRARGVDVDQEVSRMGDPVPPMFWFRDPDGNRYLVVQQMS